MSNKFVPAYGPENSPILIIGEAPGEFEESQGKPFVGPSGELLDSILGQHGYSREDVRVTNLCGFRPDGNDFERLSPSIVKAGVEAITNYEIKNKKLVILLGDKPLQYIAKKFGITNWRGSPIPFSPETLLVPTFHPSYVIHSRQRGDGIPYTLFNFDIQKAFRYLKQGYQRPVENFIIDPRGYEAEQAIEEILSSPRVSVDIESVKGSTHILCCGFATSREKAFCFVNHGLDRSDVVFTGYLSRILSEQKVKKIFHNGYGFDVEMLRHNGVSVEGYEYDTMLAMHVLEPEFELKLKFITSIYTDLPYYKDQGRSSIPDDEKGWSSKEDKNTLYTYNCRDVISTFWCMEEMEKDLDWDIYNYEQSLVEVSLELQRSGMLIDLERNNLIKKILVDRWSEKQSMLNSIAKRKLNVSSSPQCQEYLYQDLKLPVQKKFKGDITTDDDAIVKLIAFALDKLNTFRDKSKCDEWIFKLGALKLIRDIRGIRKLLSSYITIDLINDRAYSIYKITGTESDRWSCSMYFDKGLNAQTFPREVLEYET